MTLKPTLGHLSPSSPRAETWRRIYGGLTVPLQSPLAVVAAGPDGKPARFYLLDIDAVLEEDSEALERIAGHVAEAFGLPLDEVWADIDEVGVPILAEDVSVSFDGRLVLD